METITLERPDLAGVPAVQFAPAGVTGPWLLSHQGLGMPRVQRRSQQAVEQAGYTDIGYRVQPRDVILRVGLAAVDRPALDRQRRRLWDVLRPTDTALDMQVRTEDGQTRHLAVHYIRGLEYRSRDRKAHTEQYSLQFRAPAAFLRGAQRHSVTIIGTGSQDGMEFPMAFPMMLGGVAWGALHSFSYDGSAPVYPDVIVYGQMQGIALTLRNLTGEHTIVLDPTYSLKADHRLEFRLAAGRKDVILVDALGGETSGYGVLSVADTFLPGWRLEPGSNAIQIGATASDAHARVEVQYHEQYMGL